MQILTATVLTVSASFIELFSFSALAPRVEPSSSEFLKEVSVASSSGSSSCVVDPYGRSVWSLYMYHMVIAQ